MRWLSFLKFGIPLWGLLSVMAVGANSAPKCAQIYYDSVPGASPPFDFSRIHAIFLANLLGHFPSFQTYLIPIEKYQKNQIERCSASIYLGNYYDNPIPPDFIDDFVHT